MMDRVHWKWWKASPGPEDMVQQRIELVDIWHFALSLALEGGEPPDNVTQDFMQGWNIQRDSAGAAPDLIERVAFISLGLLQGYPDADVRGLIKAFGSAARHYDLPLDALFTLYVGKNALNHFRAQNGYKTGGYRKHWSDGREDNGHLEDVMAQADAASTQPSDLMPYVMARLQERYNA